jgi:signal transduction histidine kinase/CheY-like chemotaxis protein
MRFRQHFAVALEDNRAGVRVSLFEIHPSIADLETRRQSRLLSVCIAVLTPIFFCVDVVLTTTTKNHTPPWIGYAFLVGTFVLNRLGRYRAAASVAMVMFPLVGFGQIFLETVSLPLATMGYVAIGPLLGAIFLSIRGVVALAVFNVLAIALASRVVPSVRELGAAVVGPLSLNAMLGALASLYMHHRDGVEADRRGVLLAEVAERKQLEDRLREAQKMEALGKFAGGIAHDFNNVLMVIMGNVALLARRSPSAEAQQIENAVSSAAALTRQLLAFGRRAVIEPTVLDVGHVVTEAVTMIRRIIGEAIVVQREVPNVPLQARLDRAQLEQVLLNLATNARDAMPSGGTLQITVQARELGHSADELPPDAEPGPYVCLTVRDDGIGMDEATQQRAFEPFFTTKPRGRGTGLGLATVFGIVTQSGGFIRVSSHPGLGTSFELYFPRSAGALESGKVPIKGAPTRGAECVLIVEDDDGVRAIVAMILGEAGYEVVRASSLSEARIVFRERGYSFALVITDMVLADGHGLDFAEELKVSHPDVPVLCMSGYAEREGFEPSSKGLSHLQKPFSADELLGKARGLIDESVSRRSHSRELAN